MDEINWALVIGNIFSLLYAICLGISVVKKSKKDAVFWLIMDGFCCIASEIALCAYAAMTTNAIALVRNWLSYKNKLTGLATLVLCVCFVGIGLLTNNRGVIGLLPILAGSSFCVFMYISKTAQHLRYACVGNLPLWMIHDILVQSYPAAVMEFVLTLWTIVQIYKHRNEKEEI